MTVAACYCVYDDYEWLKPSLTSIYDAVDAIYVLVSDAPWNGPFTETQQTIEVINTFPDPQKKIRLKRGSWRSEVEQRNAALALVEFEKIDYALIIDADEVYDTNSLKRMIAHAAAHPDVGCWHSLFVVYWKSPSFRIDPPEPHHPPILLRMGSGAFVEYRNCICDKHALIPPEIGFCHHLSYARTNEQMERKLKAFSHASQVRPGWYEEKWLAWDRDHSISDLNPCIPDYYQRAVPVAPEALLEVLKK